jgi:WD40 repeat protein
MSDSRFGHTASLLPNGLVLVAGGSFGTVQSGGSINSRFSAELYDPIAGTFSSTDGMSRIRTGHTATVLASGKVLMAGTNIVAEIYDPTTGTFRVTGSMESARQIHGAALLPNGTVLLAGGIFTGTGLSSAELFFPLDPPFRPAGFQFTADISPARDLHTATRLPNGKILIAGGKDNPTLLRSARLYDPVAGTYANTGAMNIARENHTATLLPDGRVLITGGFNGTALPLTAEIYDPNLPSIDENAVAVQGLFTPTGNMSSGRQLHTSTLLSNGKVLITAGQLLDGTKLGTAELFDPAGNVGLGSFGTPILMAIPRSGHTATLLPDGKVLIFGGQTSDGSLVGITELFDPAGNSGAGAFTGGVVTGLPRFLHTAILLPNGKVLIAGGAGSGGLLTAAELYDPVSGTLSLAGNNMGTGRTEHTMTLLPNGKVLIAGGRDSVVFDSAELFDPLGNSGAGAFTPATGNLESVRFQHSAVLLPNGKVLITGGLGSDSVTSLSSSELYKPGN